ncbi:hypothetical protein GFC29_2504 [Anoxybacillus sp. B7M1]|jgi:hypothetical protein|uniref:nucleotidyl transferase AbiEii/AbiGii toxin family protein n=1 Tax=unclassified Anoxybacillus TaxID=2639704 RepID=UPI0007B5A0C5|nr:MULTISPECIES: nucleotidyl transferase AbiEii/AbiGii toxin family protein [unclassified Anoxybacillus]ANB56274.1 hypothetical protein GFC28_2931 [Anoxybacillus sp. B2M1]ANB62758.1 hypothetical protein GFC29_2504 [Anoxybacillus sp. B7M1]
MGNVKNIPSSVSERLKNIAKQNGKNFDLILLLYFQERLLYRLSISNYRDKFVLKGGLFLFSLTQFKSRPTKDIDFLAKQISNDIQYIKAAFESICALTVEEDGVEFDVNGITAERIKEDADYEGVRIKIPASLGRMKKQLQLDIGFGDVIIPKPRDIQYPSLGRVTPMQYLLFYETTKQENDGTKNEHPRHIAYYGKVKEIIYDIQPGDYMHIPELQPLMNDPKFWDEIRTWETTNVVLLREVGTFANPLPLKNGLEARYLVNKTTTLPLLRNATYIDELY